MIMAVVPKNSGDAVLDALINAGYTATFSETRGGMLRQSQLSLFIAVKEAEVPAILNILKSQCKTKARIHNEQGPHHFDPTRQPAILLGGAVVFIWALDYFENI